MPVRGAPVRLSEDAFVGVLPVTDVASQKTALAEATELLAGHFCNGNLLNQEQIWIMQRWANSEEACAALPCLELDAVRNGLADTCGRRDQTQDQTSHRSSRRKPKALRSGLLCRQQ